MMLRVGKLLEKLVVNKARPAETVLAGLMIAGDIKSHLPTSLLCDHLLSETTLLKYASSSPVISAR